MEAAAVREHAGAPAPAVPRRAAPEPSSGAGAGLPRFLGGTGPARLDAPVPGFAGETGRDLVAHASTCSCGGTCARCRAGRALMEAGG